MTRSGRALFLILAQFAPVTLWAAGDRQAAIGYSSKGVLHIATESGRILRTLEVKPPIGDFAISPDGQTVVFSPLGTEYGGPLYLLSVSSGRIELLAQDHYYVRGEVYSDPDFSPDGVKVVFAIHGEIARSVVES